MELANARSAGRVFEHRGSVAPVPWRSWSCLVRVLKLCGNDCAGDAESYRTLLLHRQRGLSAHRLDD